MIKRIIRIYINSFKYTRRLNRMYKIQNKLIKEFDMCDTLSEKKMIYKYITDIQVYTDNLFKEFESYVESNRFKGVKQQCK